MKVIHHVNKAELNESCQYTNIRYAVVNVKNDELHQFSPLAKCRDYLNEFLYFNLSDQYNEDDKDETTIYGYTCTKYDEFEKDKMAIFFSYEQSFDKSGLLLPVMDWVGESDERTPNWDTSFFGHPILQLNLGVVVAPPEWAYINAAAFTSWVGCVRLAMYTNSTTEQEMISRITSSLKGYNDASIYIKLEKELGMNSMLEFFSLPIWKDTPFVLSLHSNEVDALHNNSGIHTIVRYVQYYTEGDSRAIGAWSKYRCGDIALAIYNDCSKLKKAG